MNLNLTCSKTHILAWLNLDNTLSLKLNGVKYLAFPKVDKRGEKYWKWDGLVSSEPKSAFSASSSLTKKELELVKSYQEKVAHNYKMQDFSKAEVDAYGKWSDEQAAQKKQQEQITSQSQKVANNLQKRLENKHANESTSS
jgi:hypothetical protein